ncbi:probable E3 ubiquitin-protein ligase ATL41 at C-terminar half [Coccomyxa sp. Obi]|nr:probable E3 ubiquitin-protein ligase ATL41 at C-terminar half [Coccomyxa sp. Obi]
MRLVNMKGLVTGAVGLLGAAAGAVASVVLTDAKRLSLGERTVWAAFGAALSLQALHTARRLTARKRRRRPSNRDPASFSDYLRNVGASELPWAFREPADAEALLRAAVSGGLPQRRVERLALLHVLMRLHREAHARSGNPVNALGQAIAQQQFNQLVDVMTYEELYEYFGGPSMPEGLSEEVMEALPTAKVGWRDGAATVTGRQVSECAICLEGFARGEKVRELPACSHVFHKACVDRWLRSHSACPLCRTAL